MHDVNAFVMAKNGDPLRKTSQAHEDRLLGSATKRFSEG